MQMCVCVLVCCVFVCVMCDDIVGNVWLSDDQCVYAEGESVSVSTSARASAKSRSESASDASSASVRDDDSSSSGSARGVGVLRLRYRYLADVLHTHTHTQVQLMYAEALQRFSSGYRARELRKEQVVQLAALILAELTHPDNDSSTHTLSLTLSASDSESIRTEAPTIDAAYVVKYDQAHTRVSWDE